MALWMHLVSSSSSISIFGPSAFSKSQMEPNGTSKMFDPSIVYLAAKPLITQSMTVATETGGHCLAAVKALWVTLSPSHKHSLISPPPYYLYCVEDVMKSLGSSSLIWSQLQIVVGLTHPDQTL